jgi:adenylate cyclase class IV
MIIEKKRETWISDYFNINIELDELPLPLGYFIELEINSSESELIRIKNLLGFTSFKSEEKDYGEMVKELTGGRKLVFPRENY